MFLNSDRRNENGLRRESLSQASMSGLQVLSMVRGHALRDLPERAGRMLQIETCSTKQTN